MHYITHIADAYGCKAAFCFIPHGTSIAFFSGIMLVFCRLAQVHLPICRQVSMAVQLVLLLTTLHIPLVAFVIPSIMANLIMANSLGICSL
jgi:uncharacterized protein with PQ loop repeat